MNLDAQAAIDAQREWDIGRRDEGYEKLVVTPTWELRPVAKAVDARPYTGRQAKCPDCGATPPSALLLAFYPDRIKERPGEECDLYIHECGS